MAIKSGTLYIDLKGGNIISGYTADDDGHIFNSLKYNKLTILQNVGFVRGIILENIVASGLSFDINKYVFHYTYEELEYMIEIAKDDEGKTSIFAEEL